MPEVTPTHSTTDPIRGSRKDVHLWKAAQSLEANFLSEMLKGAGLGHGREAFGGGIGEDQFSDFLAGSYAEALVEKGGIGLSEALYRSLLDRRDAR